jgi:Flp pilus assembly protein TadG
MASPRRSERGLSESVQFAVVWPLLVLLTLGIIQAGLWLHGRNVAQRAAATAVDVARGSYGIPAEARRKAERLAAAGGLRSVTVDLSTGGVEVRATVSADAPTIVEIGAGRLHESASAPRERVTQP